VSETTQLLKFLVWLEASRFPSFLFMQSLALLAAGYSFVRRLPSTHPKMRLLLALAVGAPLGAIALGCILRLPALLADPTRVHILGEGWLMAYGGLSGALAAVCLGARQLERDASVAADALAPSLGLLVGFGRLGCFFAGCDYGRPTSFPIAIFYPAGSHAFASQVRHGLLTSSATHSLPVHPVQVYEALAGFLVFLVARRSTRPLVTSTCCYAVARIALEFLRGDAHARALGLNVSQWLSLGVLACAAFLAVPTSESACTSISLADGACRRARASRRTVRSRLRAPLRSSGSACDAQARTDSLWKAS
jgi:phosphatidylglycerol---prolipoprotein diacylglyceryl transferase